MINNKTDYALRLLLNLAQKKQPRTCGVPADR